MNKDACIYGRFKIRIPKCMILGFLFLYNFLLLQCSQIELTNSDEYSRNENFKLSIRRNRRDNSNFVPYHKDKSETHQAKKNTFSSSYLNSICENEIGTCQRIQTFDEDRFFDNDILSNVMKTQNMFDFSYLNNSVCQNGSEPIDLMIDKEINVEKIEQPKINNTYREIENHNIGELENHHTEEIENYHIEGIENYHIEGIENYHTEEIENYHIEGIENYHIEEIENYDIEEIENRNTEETQFEINISNNVNECIQNNILKPSILCSKIVSKEHSYYKTKFFPIVENLKKLYCHSHLCNKLKHTNFSQLIERIVERIYLEKSCSKENILEKLFEQDIGIYSYLDNIEDYLTSINECTDPFAVVDSAEFIFIYIAFIRVLGTSQLRKEKSNMKERIRRKKRDIQTTSQNLEYLHSLGDPNGRISKFRIVYGKCNLKILFENMKCIHLMIHPELIQTYREFTNTLQNIILKFARLKNMFSSFYEFLDSIHRKSRTQIIKELILIKKEAHIDLIEEFLTEATRKQNLLKETLKKLCQTEHRMCTLLYTNYCGLILKCLLLEEQNMDKKPLILQILEKLLIWLDPFLSSKDSSPVSNRSCTGSSQTVSLDNEFILVIMINSMYLLYRAVIHKVKFKINNIYFRLTEFEKSERTFIGSDIYIEIMNNSQNVLDLIEAAMNLIFYVINKRDFINMFADVFDKSEKINQKTLQLDKVFFNIRTKSDPDMKDLLEGQKLFQEIYNIYNEIAL